MARDKLLLHGTSAWRSTTRCEFPGLMKRSVEIRAPEVRRFQYCPILIVAVVPASRISPKFALRILVLFAFSPGTPRGLVRGSGATSAASRGKNGKNYIFIMHLTQCRCMFALPHCWAEKSTRHHLNSVCPSLMIAHEMVL